jgi:hypothetical protein
MLQKLSFSTHRAMCLKQSVLQSCAKGPIWIAEILSRSTKLRRFQAYRYDTKIDAG